MSAMRDKMHTYHHSTKCKSRRLSNSISTICNEDQACRVVRYGTITVYTVRTVLVKLRRTTVIITSYFTIITVKYGTVPSWHCQCKNGHRKASPPQNLPFLLPGVLLPCADATQCFHERPEAGLGLHQLRGCHCQCKVGLRKASPPQTPPISTSSMLLLRADATQCFPGRPWGWVEAVSAWGKGPAVACMETQIRTQYLIPG